MAVARWARAARHAVGAHSVPVGDMCPLNQRDSIWVIRRCMVRSLLRESKAYLAGAATLLLTMVSGKETRPMCAGISGECISTQSNDQDGMG